MTGPAPWSLVLVALLTAGCAPPEPQLCNGHAALCDRRLDQVAFAATHNAMSNAEDGWLAPNQGWSVPHQLEAGVRGLNLDVYDVDGVATLCHGYCELGSAPFADVLADVNGFLDDHPDDVLLITLESYVPAALATEAFEDSGLAPRMIDHDAGEDWPTLAELIAADTRVAVWASDGGAPSGAYLDQWSDWVDTAYPIERGEDFPCAPDRGAIGNPFFNVNHFITDPIASAKDAAEANTAAVLGEHVDRCWQTTGHFPNQVLVDFADEGDVLDIVAGLNARGP